MDATRHPPTQDPLLAALRDIYGHGSFRPGQRPVIECVLSGRDCLAVMPTGAGKSVTFQLPARLLPGCVLVVSPLLALMSDQVAGACRRGLAAASIHSGLTPDERARVLARLRAGEIELLYCSPEGLPRLLGECRGARFALLAIDEAHCISEWGHDFRPSYRLLGDVAGRVGDVPVLAVTATATSRVAADIVTGAGLRDPYVFRGSVFRPGLILSARRKDRLVPVRDEVAAVVAAHPGGAGIVYCLSRRGAAILATHLRRSGVPAAVYHAGMTTSDREEVQGAFLDGSVPVVVATIAFGMGVDKPDVRFVVHADMPGSIEAYSQEIGRAGRDGAPADCLLLYSWADVRRRDGLSGGLARDRRLEVARRVREVYRFAAGGTCRHVRLCAHFGERIAACGESCDRCRAAVGCGAGRSGRPLGCC